MNENKPYALYETLFGKLLQRSQRLAPGHHFKFNNLLYSLDATVIDRCLSIFPWADFRTTKGAIKLHVGLNHAGYLPEFVTITEGSTHEVNIGMVFPSLSATRGLRITLPGSAGRYRGLLHFSDCKIGTAINANFQQYWQPRLCPN